MIGESSNYKEHLFQFIAKFRKWHHTNRWSEKRIIEYEKEIFICFFYIRKLIEANRLTNKIANQHVKLTCYKPIRTVHRLNANSIEKLYDFDKYANCILSLPELCNQVIHSYVFSICYGRGESFIIVSSDHKRNEMAYRLDHSLVIDLFESVARDNATVCLQGRWNEKRQDYVFLFAFEEDKMEQSE